MPRCGYGHPDSHKVGAILDANQFYEYYNTKGIKCISGYCKRCRTLYQKQRYAKKHGKPTTVTNVGKPVNVIAELAREDCRPARDLSPSELGARLNAIARANRLKS